MKLLILFIATQLFLVQVAFAQSELWGVSSAGGGDNIGTIFSTDGEGDNFEQEFAWKPAVSGNGPTASLTEGLDGRLYGVTYGGGLYGLGVLFEYDPDFQTYIKRFQFGEALSGAQPYGRLVLASNGKLYGVTLKGGTNDEGTLFEYDPVDRLVTTKVNFATSTGALPFVGLVESTNGKLYGVAAEGGAHDKGVLYEYNTATETYTKLVDFDGENLGENPYTSLIEGTPNVLYGMAARGGLFQKGVIFKFNTQTNVLTKTYDFGFDETQGYEPLGNFCQGTNDLLYAMTYKGGTDLKGVLFEYNINDDSYVKRVDFTGLNGSKSTSGMVSGTGDVLYGLCTTGGTNSGGTLFEYNTTTHTLVTEVNLKSATTGSVPYNEMILKNGIYYGMTSHGGSQNSGVIFQYNPTTKVYKVNLEFENSVDGARPYGSLFEASNGLLYGLTKNGGKNDKGTLYEFDPVTNQIEVKVDFIYAVGTFPENGLIEPVNGKLYGTTVGGGASAGGTLFEYDIATEQLTVKASFNNSTTGANPFGRLLKASDGHLYGMTYSGGQNDLGIIYQYNLSSNALTKKIDFDGSAKGSNPRSGLIEANGKLYGMTSKGGINDIGVLFEYNPQTNGFAKKQDFVSDQTGKTPFGGLTVGPGTELFGTTFEGGANNQGVIFKFNYTDDTFTKIIDFDGEQKGASPIGPMSLNANGKFYGVCNSGGVEGYGVIYQFDPADNSFVKKHDFTLVEGRLARSGLIEICRKPAYTVPDPMVYDVCEGQTVTINLLSTNTDTYSWTKDNTAAPTLTTGVLTFDPVLVADDGTYEAEMTNVCGVTQSVPITINVTNDILPTVTIAASDDDLCKGEQVKLEGQGAVTYKWDKEVVDGQLFTPVTTQTYTVIGTDANNCSASAMVEITVANLPVIVPSVDLSVVCQGDHIELNVQGGVTYTWSHGVTEGVPYQLNTSTVFTVEGVDASGCENSAQINVVAHLLPEVTAVADFEERCMGDQVTLTAQSNTSNLIWDKGVVDGVAFSLVASDVYTVTATSSENCVNTSSISLTAIELPLVSIASHKTEICIDEELILEGEGADSYTWSNNVMDGVAFSLNKTRTLTVTGTDQVSGCKGEATTTVTVNTCTGLDDLAVLGVFVYPNPFSNELVIENRQNTIESLALYSIDGKQLKTISELDDMVTVVDLTDFVEGTYFIRVNTSNTSYQMKLIKK